MRFEAKVEGLLQALTRKHILSQAVEGRSGKGWRNTEGQDVGDRGGDHREVWL